MKRRTPQERAEYLGWLITKKIRAKWWCKSVIPEIIDIRKKETDPIALALGMGDFYRGCKLLGIEPDAEVIRELGCLPYASQEDRVEWEAEAAELNEAHRNVVTARRAQYQRQQPRYERKRPTKHAKRQLRTA